MIRQCGKLRITWNLQPKEKSKLLFSEEPFFFFFFGKIRVMIPILNILMGMLQRLRGEKHGRKLSKPIYKVNYSYYYKNGAVKENIGRVKFLF